jgi:hypothetical protein
MREKYDLLLWMAIQYGMILRLLLSAPAMGILLQLEHLHSSSLTVNIISPYIFLKNGKHLGH